MKGRTEEMEALLTRCLLALHEDDFPALREDIRQCLGKTEVTEAEGGSIVHDMLRDFKEGDEIVPEDEGDDVCDKCMRSGVQVSQTDENGDTVCAECAETPKPRKK